MAIKFDPTNQSTNLYGSQPPSKPKLILFRRWIDLVYDGCLKESLSPQKYCERLWNKQNGFSSSKATEVFMKACIAEYVDYKRYCRWSRLN